MKRDFAAWFHGEPADRSKTLLGELRKGLRRIDEAHNAALWATVRETFDYPVFVAAPKTVGITSAGETVEAIPNDLSAILDAWHAFIAWVEAGAASEDAPDFHLPSAA